MDKQKSREEYRLRAAEAAQWEEIAEGHLYSAKVLNDRLSELMSNPFVSRRVRTNALVSSTMFFLGLAVENMYKAIHAARNPELASEERLDTSSWKKDGSGGHGHFLVGPVGSFLDLNQKEKDLLKRLEVHVIWAGKYHVPLTSDVYHASRLEGKRSFAPRRDFEIATNLLRRLRSLSRKASAERDEW